MQADLKGKVALVTGAGRGIGRAIAGALARGGAEVVAAARTAAEIESLASALRAAGHAARAVATDVSVETSVDALFAQIAQHCGRLDILVNNAGLGLFGPLEDFPAASFDRLMNVNVRGAFLCSQRALKLMIAQRSGYIINISSVVGFKGYPNQGAYAATKHALMGLTKVLAVEGQKHNIRASAILPGGVNTALVGDARPDLKREELLQPEDIAETVMFLLALPERAAIDEIYIRRRNSQPF
ncbi:MAG: SDR family oxidoreductase [Planctomycetota bacterium]